jgi:hypothetical protein
MPPTLAVPSRNTLGAVVVVGPGRRKGGGSIVCAYRPVRLAHTQFAPVCVCVCACGDAWRQDRSLEAVDRPTASPKKWATLPGAVLRSITQYYIYIYMARRTAAYDAKYAICQMSTSSAPPAAAAVKHTRGQRCLWFNPCVLVRRSPCKNDVYVVSAIYIYIYSVESSRTWNHTTTPFDSTNKHPLSVGTTSFQHFKCGVWKFEQCRNAFFLCLVRGGRTLSPTRHRNTPAPCPTFAFLFLTKINSSPLHVLHGIRGACWTVPPVTVNTTKDGNKVIPLSLWTIIESSCSSFRTG